jgi:hypothetical protein
MLPQGKKHDSNKAVRWLGQLLQFRFYMTSTEVLLVMYLEMPSELMEDLKKWHHQQAKMPAPQPQAQEHTQPFQPFQCWHQPCLLELFLRRHLQRSPFYLFLILVSKCW